MTPLILEQTVSLPLVSGALVKGPDKILDAMERGYAVAGVTFSITIVTLTLASAAPQLHA